MHPGLTGRSSYFAWNVPLPNTWNRDVKNLKADLKADKEEREEEKKERRPHLPPPKPLRSALILPQTAARRDAGGKKNF